MGQLIPQRIAPSAGAGIRTPTHTVPWAQWPTRVHNPNGASIGSAVFVGLTVLTNRHTQAKKQNNRPQLRTTCVRCGLIIKTDRDHSTKCDKGQRLFILTSDAQNSRFCTPTQHQFSMFVTVRPTAVIRGCHL